MNAVYMLTGGNAGQCESYVMVLYQLDYLWVVTGGNWDKRAVAWF